MARKITKDIDAFRDNDFSGAVAMGRGIPGDVTSGSGPLQDSTRPTGKGLKAIKDALKNIKGANQPKKGQV